MYRIKMINIVTKHNGYYDCHILIIDVFFYAVNAFSQRIKKAFTNSLNKCVLKINFKNQFFFYSFAF